MFFFFSSPGFLLAPGLDLCFGGSIASRTPFLKISAAGGLKFWLSPGLGVLERRPFWGAFRALKNGKDWIRWVKHGETDVIF